VPGAWLGAALWALHPVQVESVAWICELKNTQSAVFFLAAMWFWARWLDGGRERDASVPATPPTVRRDYVLAIACAVLALLSKPSTVMLPCALVLAVAWVRRRITLRDVLALAPFFALSAFAAGWTIWEQKFHSGAIGPEWSQTFLERIAIAGRAIWFYLGKLLWPAPLIFIYPRWDIDASHIWTYVAPLGVLGAFAVLYRARLTSLRPVLFAFAFFVALLFPILGFFSVYFFRYSFVGDHFQYLASMAPCALLAAGLTRLQLRTYPLAAGALLSALGILTAAQSGDYRSSEALWRATTTRNPGSPMAWAQLGSVHSKAGRHPEAIACFQRALQLNPAHPEALNHLGCEYLLLGRGDEAIAALQRAIEARPGFAEAHVNLGIALVQDGRPADALAQFTTALQLRPEAAEPHLQLAGALSVLGRLPEAIAHYETALRLAPGRASTHDALGLVLAAAGRTDEAVRHYLRALELQPELGSAHHHLGVILAQAQRMPEALVRFNEAVRLAPEDAEAHMNRGGALASLGRLPEAAEAFSRVVQLDPTSSKAHAYLAQVLRALGRESEAREHLERAMPFDTAIPAKR
jgi:tetratricopeptide (TPR) repeat protein